MIAGAMDYGRGELIVERIEGSRIFFMAWRGNTSGSNFWRLEKGSISSNLCTPAKDPDLVVADFVAWRLTQ